MSWSFSLALVEEFKRQGCLVTESYARLKKMRSAEKSSWLGRKTGQHRPSQSGTTREPLTVSLGAAPLMSSVVGSRVSPLAKRGNKKQTKTSATCGPIHSESYARYDRESSSWRMSPDLFGCTYPVSWETWPSQGTMRNGACWERSKSEHPTPASGFGSTLWLTPTANEDAAGTPGGKMQPMLGNHPEVRGATPAEWSRGTLNPLWVEWLMGWPIGWTALLPLGTDKCPNATLPLGDC